MPRLSITNFSRGEFARHLYARIDIPQYSAGAKRLHNFIVQRYGGVAFRPGFRFVGEVDDATKTYSLRGFQYSIEQAYILLMGDTTMRVLAYGGFLTEDNLKIVAVTKGVTTTLKILLHGYVAGDRLYLDGITGMVELNGRFVKVVQVVDANHVKVDVDSRAFSTVTSSDGSSRTSVPAPPTAPEPVPPPPTSLPPPPPSTGGSPGNVIEYEEGPGTYHPPPPPRPVGGEER
jgi:hypothetical protein